MKKDLIIMSILFILMLISFNYDKSIVNYVADHRIDIINPLMVFITLATSDIAILIIMVFFMTIKKKEYKNIPILMFSLVIVFLLTTLLKFIIARPRPIVEKLVEVTSYSFPSRHSSIAFGALPIFMKGHKNLSYLWIIIALLIAISRVYVGAHYPSDVIGGILLGYITSLIILKLEEKYDIILKIKKRFSF